MEKNKKTIESMIDSAQFMLECEARFWKRYVKENGYAVWNVRKDAIRKKRGQEGLDRLLKEMNK